MQEGAVSLFSSLPELKGFLQIDPEDRSEDKLLAFFSHAAAAWIEKYLNRRGYVKKERTEYYDGSSTQSLQLLSLPVHTSPTIRVWIDEDSPLYGELAGSFPDAKELTYGTDFGLERADSTTGVSQTGILVRTRNVWPRPGIRQKGYLSPFIGQSFGTIKVVYTGGHTTDTMPGDVVLAAVQLVARMRQLFPLGVPLASESYEERSIGLWNGAFDKHWLTAQVKFLLSPHRRYRF
jgi:hypothetical protein